MALLRIGDLGKESDITPIGGRGLQEEEAPSVPAKDSKGARESQGYPYNRIL